MAAFIVISADNRLHHLVDGILKCRPLNPSVVTNISTGKIIKSDSESYIYEYSIPGEGSKSGGAKSLNELLSNQLAAFRLAFSIPNEQLVNIFFLENPLTEADYEESQSWIEEFGKVYDKGSGSDTAFCLYRILFSYCQEKPTDVCPQIDHNVLQRIIEPYRIDRSYKDKFLSHIFYIDNQRCDAAATCLSKEDHDLKMPRFLLDFMMLSSNTMDSYNVLNAISGSTNNVKCFSVGFGESMYYFPDVVEYYTHADKKDMYSKYLNDNDETGDDKTKKAMDAEKHPFGLKKRKNRLGIIYNDVPFNENIDAYPNTADWFIDNNIIALKKYIEEEYRKEWEDFLNSEPIVSKNQRILQIEEEIILIEKTDDETDEDFEKRKSDLQSEKELLERELHVLKAEFKPDCPSYIDRHAIFTNLSVIMDEEECNETSQNLKRHYNELIEFILSKKFLDFVKNQGGKLDCPQPQSHPQQVGNETEYNKENNPGCLGRLFFWKKKEIDPLSSGPEVEPLQPDVQKKESSPVDLITEIANQKKLKNTYFSFALEVNRIQNIFDTELSFCDNFKLKTHTNHYFPLICLRKLKEQQTQDFMSRVDDVVSKWRSFDNPTKTSLDILNEEISLKHTKKYEYINWDEPFSFIEELSVSKLSAICNELQKKAYPFVNYNLNPEQKDNRVVRALFSDRPSFVEEFAEMKDQLANGTEISAYFSTHIASKICFMEFLPMDDEVLDNLVDFQEVDNDDIFKRILSDIEIKPKDEIVKTDVEDNDPPVEFWGEHGD